MTPGRAAEGRAQRESIAGEKPYRFSGPRSKAIPKRVLYGTPVKRGAGSRSCLRQFEMASYTRRFAASYSASMLAFSAALKFRR